MTVRDSKVTLGQLRFKKPIISTVNEPIPTKELLSRLQILTDRIISGTSRSGRYRNFCQHKERSS